MKTEKWYEIKEQIKERFEVLKEETEKDNIEDDTGKVYEGEREILIFNGLQGKMKLERVTHPLIIDKKMHYHKGAGGTAKVEYVVSSEDTSSKLNAYVWDEQVNDWKELELPGGTVRF